MTRTAGMLREFSSARAQRHRAFELAVVVAGRVRRLAGAGVERRRRVDEHRRRRQPAIDRGGVEERLEGRAQLPIRLRRAVELAAREAEAADHRQDLARCGCRCATSAPSIIGCCSSVTRRRAGGSSSEVMPTSIRSPGLHEIRGVRAARPLIARAASAPPCSGPKRTRARWPCARVLRVHTVTTAGTMSPAAIGRAQRSCRKPSSVCLSARTLRAGLRQAPRRLRHLPQARDRRRDWRRAAARRRASCESSGRSRTAPWRRTWPRRTCGLPR